MKEIKYVYHEYDFDSRVIGPVEREEMERCDDIEDRVNAYFNRRAYK